MSTPGVVLGIESVNIQPQGGLNKRPAQVVGLQEQASAGPAVGVPFFFVAVKTRSFQTTSFVDYFALQTAQVHVECWRIGLVLSALPVSVCHIGHPKPVQGFRVLFVLHVKLAKAAQSLALWLKLGAEVTL
jgi:hypothetical protein